MTREYTDFRVGEELNCVRETKNSEDSYAVAVMHICSAQDVSCLCSVCELSHARMRIMRVGVTKYIMLYIEFGGCFAIGQTAKFKFSPNVSAIRYVVLSTQLSLLVDVKGFVLMLPCVQSKGEIGLHDSQIVTTWGIT